MLGVTWFYRPEEAVGGRKVSGVGGVGAQRRGVWWDASWEEQRGLRLLLMMMIDPCVVHQTPACTPSNNTKKHRNKTKQKTPKQKAFHGEKELFGSDHVDRVHVSTVLSKCRVLPLKKYQELPDVGPHDYFSRFVYRVSRIRIKYIRIRVFLFVCVLCVR